jgi:hypothetical protein
MTEIVETAGSVVALAATIGILLLVPLHLSQRRDLARLRRWMDSAPGHPAADLAASEAILDRAEAELEATLGVPAPPARMGVGPGDTAPLPSAVRPALEQVTMEREALEPHPRWRHFAARATQPRVLGIVALAAAVLGIAVVFGSERLLEPGDGDGAPRPGAVVPEEVEVAVLNGTPVAGLAGKVADDVQANGFELGNVTNSGRPYDQTVVMFAAGQERAGKRVAHDLGVPVQPLDSATQRLADGADVVVIAGQDRAAP